ncbi:MAG: Unknown protein, partial [uncultured Sulfurovum sp.]
ACFKAGVYTFKGEGVKADSNKSFEFFHKACDLNASNVCTRLAMTYENNESLRYDINQSITLYKKACSLKNVRACDALGYLYTKEHGALKADHNLSVKYFMKTCELADYTCAKIGAAYELGKGLKQNTDNAMKFYEKACDNNATQACSKLGRLYLEKDTYKKAQTVLAKACEAKDHWSCSQLGNLYEKGVEDIAKDNNKSLMFHDKACNFGSRTSCSELGMAYLVGKDTPKDINKAIEYLSKACDKAEAKACAMIASIYLKGDGVPANKIKALSFSDRACRFGDKEACGLK